MNNTEHQPPSTLQLRHISFAYPKGPKILDDFSMEFYRGTIYGIVGRNGVGKTTLGKLMVKLLSPDSGAVLINGTDLQSLTLSQVGGHIGYLYQSPDRQLFASTVYQELSFILALKKRENIPQIVESQLEKFHLSHLRDQFPFLLSQGEKQRLVLAGILLESPDFLILDEPTTALDWKRKGELQSILLDLQQETGLGIIIISHDRPFLSQLGYQEVHLERAD